MSEQPKKESRELNPQQIVQLIFRRGCKAATWSIKRVGEVQPKEIWPGQEWEEWIDDLIDINEESLLQFVNQIESLQSKEINRLRKENDQLKHELEEAIQIFDRIIPHPYAVFDDDGRGGEGPIHKSIVEWLSKQQEG